MDDPLADAKTALHKAKSTIRKASQKLVTLANKACLSCGATKNLQRHHEDYASAQVMVLCQRCHAAHHVREGTWASGPKATRQCKVCGMTFAPSHSKKNITCSRECLSIAGRQAASRRWGDGNRLMGQCVVCGKEYAKTSYRSKTCGKTCLVAAKTQAMRKVWAQRKAT